MDAESVGFDVTGMRQYTLPFNHTIIDDFISPSLLRQINDEWPSDWLVEDGSFNCKWSTQALPETARKLVEQFDVGLVQRATGIEGLFADPELFGAGLHCIPPGGFLKMHVDFNQHPNGWHRRANVLIYLNEDWNAEWGGRLHLGIGGGAKRIVPIGGRCVIFETNETSWHGHPDALACPPDRQRRSMALYFYTKDAPSEAAHSTIYKKKAA